MRPACENCMYEANNSENCTAMMVGFIEFDINPCAEKLLIDTDLPGFCEYYHLKPEFKDKVDYSIKQIAA